ATTNADAIAKHYGHSPGAILFHVAFRRPGNLSPSPFGPHCTAWPVIAEGAWGKSCWATYDASPRRLGVSASFGPSLYASSAAGEPGKWQGSTGLGSRIPRACKHCGRRGVAELLGRVKCGGGLPEWIQSPV